jgi:hypothetical protein
MLPSRRETHRADMAKDRSRIEAHWSMLMLRNLSARSLARNDASR